MLESLTIRNFAIIDELTVVFTQGLTVITGETGAGKSIIVDALELALGSRSSVEMIRAGADSLSVTGVFTLESPLEGEEIPLEEGEGIIILRREVRADGTGRCYINDRPATLRALKALGDRLVDLHGQHDHQSLLDASGHILFLDGFGKLIPLAREVAELYEAYNAGRETIKSIRDRIESGRRERELFQFQIEEIREAELKPGEDAELEQEIMRLARAGDLKMLGMQAFSELSEGEGSIADRLGELSARISDLARFDGRLSPLLAEIENAVASVSELAREFRNYSERIDDDPGALARLESRLGLVEKMKQKYGPSLDDVLAYFQKISADTRGAEHLEEELSECEARTALLQSRLAERALKLSEGRRDAAPRLSKEVESHLKELGMSGARLAVEILPCESGCEITVGDNKRIAGRNGFDRVEFLVSANPGEPPRSLVKVASGGEVSRIMLSLKLALSEIDSVPTMIFDEIDSGVSGRVADAVGAKLRKLSRVRQTLVITHLPQIAAMGDHHFSARKKADGNRVRTTLVHLDDAMRQEELASLLSGAALTEAALAHARELMERQRTCP